MGRGALSTAYRRWHHTGIPSQIALQPAAVNRNPQKRLYIPPQCMYHVSKEVYYHSALLNQGYFKFASNKKESSHANLPPILVHTLYLRKETFF